MSVLIISIEEDQATANVLDWLGSYGKEVVRINPSSAVTATVRIGVNNAVQLQVEDKEIDLSNISAFWYRRGALSINQLAKHVITDNSKEALTIAAHLHAEEKVLTEYINNLLAYKKCLTDQFTTTPNKLLTLYQAQQEGLRIPDTIITSEKSILQEFLQQHGRIVCKPISEGIAATYSDGLVRMYTEELTIEFIDSLPATFPPSLAQARSDKKYELRIFYLNGDFFSMAILPAKANQGVTDIRKISLDSSTRNVPFELPEGIKEKLHSLMGRMKLKTASIDMAVTPTMEYLFFEVNPIGQYSATSHTCNYYLDKKIADFLING